MWQLNCGESLFLISVFSATHTKTHADTDTHILPLGSITTASFLSPKLQRKTWQRVDLKLIFRDMNIHCSFSSLLKLLSIALTIPVEAILLLSQEIIKAQIFPVPPSLTSSYHPWLLLSKHFLIILNFVMGNPHSVNYLLLYTEILNNSLTLKFFRFLKQLYFQV